jgi:Arc/MetJ-type ribon-helix-helix transcriptional regulator
MTNTVNQVSSGNYVSMVSSVKNALKSIEQSETKLQSMGAEVLAFFGSEKAIDEVKAQFIADAILPAIDKRHSEALAKDLPRKGSKEYNENLAKDASYSDKFEIANQAKKDARATCNTYYNRVKSYAFPKDKVETPKKDFVAKLSKLIEDGGKIKECNFDLVKTLQLLVQAETVAKTPIM